MGLGVERRLLAPSEPSLPIPYIRHVRSPIHWLARILTRSQLTRGPYLQKRLALLLLPSARCGPSLPLAHLSTSSRLSQSGWSHTRTPSISLS